MLIVKKLLSIFLLGLVNLSLAAESSEIIIGQNQDGSDMGMGLYMPATESNGAAIVFIVSGGMHSGLDVQEGYEPRFLPLVYKGFTVFAVRHTSIRNNPNPQTLVPEIFNQISLAYEHIIKHAPEYSIDSQRIGILGNSSGGVLASFLALSAQSANGSEFSTRPKAAAIYAGPSELRGNFPSLAAINLVSEDDPPVLFIHGDADDVVPFAESEKMYSALMNVTVPTELIVIEGEGHDALQNDSGGDIIFNTAILRWFTNYLID
jgi:acetyl esterase/lipase